MTFVKDFFSIIERNDVQISIFYEPMYCSVQNTCLSVGLEYTVSLAGRDDHVPSLMLSW